MGEPEEEKEVDQTDQKELIAKHMTKFNISSLLTGKDKEFIKSVKSEDQKVVVD